MQKCVFLLGLLVCLSALRAQTSKPIEVATGVTLPVDTYATVFALDAASSGPALVHIKPHEVVLASHAGSNLLRGLVYAGPHMSSEVDGPHADTILTSAKDVFFVRLSGDDAEIARTRVHLLWLQPGRKRREITDFSMNVFSGHRSRNVDEVPADTEMVEGTNWLRVTPREPLLPGEFAIAFLAKDVNYFPDNVFDFGVPGTVGDADPYAPRADVKPASKKTAN